MAVNLDVNFQQLAEERASREALYSCEEISDNIWKHPTQENRLISQQDLCSLCSQKFSQNSPPKSLYCGHLYHKTCYNTHVTQKIADHFATTNSPIQTLACHLCDFNILTRAIDQRPHHVSLQTDESFLTSLTSKATKLAHNLFQTATQTKKHMFTWLQSLNTHPHFILKTALLSLVTLPFSPILSSTINFSATCLSLTGSVLNIQSLPPYLQRKAFFSFSFLLRTILTLWLGMSLADRCAASTALGVGFAQTIVAFNVGLLAYSAFFGNN